MAFLSTAWVLSCLTLWVSSETTSAMIFSLQSGAGGLVKGEANLLPVSGWSPVTFGGTGDDFGDSQDKQGESLFLNHE